MIQNSRTALFTLISTYRYYFFFALLLTGYAVNLFIDVMEVDAAQYASISREMAETGSYLHVYQHGEDYLDKPPLLFWVSSLGIKIFGHTSVAYKILPVFFLVIGLWATYRFARLWYNHRTGILAALIVGSTQAFALMSNDIRTDGLLTAFVMLSLWLLSSFLKTRHTRDLLLAGVCLGGAMLAKGPLGLMIPAAAMGGHLLISGQWKKIFDPSWLLLIPIIAIVLAPMCYGLYTQFDLHPEKEVYGLKGPSGLRFYFWTQSFGRITGESDWANNTPWYYFLQTMLWDMQPWILLFIPVLWSRVKSIWSRKTEQNTPSEWISICGFVIPLIALSFSGYKLPHYIFPVFPFAAVMIANYVVTRAEQWSKWFEFLQLLLIHLLVLAAVLILFWVFPIENYWLPVLCLILYAGIWWWRAVAIDATDRWVLPSLMGVIIFQLALGLHFYPHLLEFQSTSQAGKYIATHHPAQVYWHDRYGHALDYYSDRRIPHADRTSMDTLPAGTWIFVSPAALDAIPPHNIVKEFKDFKVTKLNVTFLNPETRNEKVKKMYLVELK